MKAILATVTVLLLSACASQPASTPQAKQSVASGTSGVSTEVWLDMMKPATASILCGPKVRLGRCFSMAEAQCEQSALSVAAKCSTLLRKNMPDVIDQSNARQWGGNSRDVFGEDLRGCELRQARRERRGMPRTFSLRAKAKGYENVLVVLQRLAAFTGPRARLDPQSPLVGLVNGRHHIAWREAITNKINIHTCLS